MLLHPIDNFILSLRTEKSILEQLSQNRPLKKFFIQFLHHL